MTVRGPYVRVHLAPGPINTGRQMLARACPVMRGTSAPMRPLQSHEHNLAEVALSILEKGHLLAPK